MKLNKFLMEIKKAKYCILRKNIRDAVRERAYKKTPVGFTKDAKLVMGKDILDGKIDWADIIQVGYIDAGVVYQ